MKALGRHLIVEMWGADNLNDAIGSVKERPWSLIRIKQPKDRKVPK